MNRFQRLLVYVQDEPARDPALARALTLARASGGSLTLVGVIGSETRAGQATCPIDQARMKERKAELEDHAAEIRASGTYAEASVVYGRPSEVIMGLVRRGGHDLVLKRASPELIEGSRRSVGTTALRLLRTCPCPVWVVRPRDGSARSVLAAVALSANEDTRQLDVAVMRTAAALATTENADLYVIHAWQDHGILWIPEPHFVHGVERARPHELVQAAMNRFLQPFRDRLAASGAVHMVQGQPEEVVPELASAIGAEILVMGTHGRSGLVGFLVGNTSERVLLQTPSSVVVVKRDQLAEEPAELPPAARMVAL